MKILSWNVRGLNAPNKWSLIRRHIDVCQAEICMFQETKLGGIALESFGRKLKLWKWAGVEAEGAFGGLLILWKPQSVLVEVMHLSRHWMACKVRSLISNLSFNLINVYGPLLCLQKKLVWLELDGILQNFQQEPSILGGDFNAILRLEDKKGGFGKVLQSQKDFCSFVERNSLFEIPISNGNFTWTNRRKGFGSIAEKLDRFFFKGNLSLFPYSLDSKINSGTGFDHFPVQLIFEGDKGPLRCPFKFEMMWFKDPHVLSLLEQWWNECPKVGSSLFNVVTKLKYLKQCLKQWNKDCFKNIFAEKVQTETELASLAEEIMKSGMNDSCYLEEKALNSKLNDLLIKEEIFWRQKSREVWLKAGDRNSKFFHNSTKARRECNKISCLKVGDGSLIEDLDEIKFSAVNYFQNLLNDWEGSNWKVQNTFLQFIPKLITQEQSNSLNAKFTEEEVKKAVFEMQPEKAPGPDGFPAGFFQKCWHFLGKEVWEAIEDSRWHKRVLKEANNTLLTLIPKKEKPEQWEDFCPISLCNTIYKILAKVVANRLKNILPFIISEEQTGFLPERSILDGIIIAQEVIHSIQKMHKSAMLLKIDIRKAYDRVNWRFLFKVMEAFGFQKGWLDWIFGWIASPRYSVLVNGSPEGFFTSSRGLRQGDPLSPFLIHNYG